MTREEIAEKVAWIIAGIAAEYHGRTIEPGQVFPSDTLVMHGIDDHLALIEFSYLAEKALGIAVSDEAVSDELLDNDVTVATLVDRITEYLREPEIKSSGALEARKRSSSSTSPRIVARRERATARVDMATGSPKSMRGDRRATEPSAA
jgi:acyl carrier protein